LISLIWFVTCNKLGILLLESSISDCFEKYILNKFALSIAKDKYNNDLITKITNMNSSCKNWWNIVKQISGIKGSDMSIPPILHNDIKSGIDGFVEFITFRTSSTSFSHNLISLI
jgi:hypothetical protein